MTKFKEWPDATINVLVGGTPCQSFSVAGLRKGLADPRGNLMLTYLAIAAKYRPQWLVWENVPGVLSSNGGNDFASLLRGLGELGYGFAYRILDAQYFGVAQRRRRVFVVGCLGDWQRAAAVLFERHSLQGNPALSRKAREEPPGAIGARTGRSIGVQDATCGHMIACDVADSLTVGANQTTGFVGDVVAQWPAEVAPTLDSHYGDKQGLENQHINGGGGCSLPEVSLCLNAGGMGRQDAESETLIPTRGGHFGEPYAFPWQQGGTLGMTGTLGMSGTLVKNQTMAVVYGLPGNWIGRKPENGGNAVEPMHDLSPNLTSTDRHAVAFADVGATLKGGSGTRGYPDPSDGNGHNIVKQAMQVRRLTPVECERLQGFPDGYTDIKPNGKQTADGPRYKALGNSMAVPVMRFIGERIASVAAISQIEEMLI